VLHATIVFLVVAVSDGFLLGSVGSVIVPGKLPLTESSVNLLDLGEGNDGVRVSEQVIHLLEGTSSSLVEEEVEEESVGEGADGENDVVFPA